MTVPFRSKLRRGLFAGLTTGATKLKFSKILGTTMSFSMFNVMAPVNGAVFGLSGVINVLLADLFLFLLNPSFTLLKFLRYLPMLLATACYAAFFRGDKRPLIMAPLMMTPSGCIPPAGQPGHMLSYGSSLCSHS
ncbi:MAG TPA: hypothetical protein ENN60_04150 [archaeon]|nr:hypothetical protein [archaeon]